MMGAGTRSTHQYHQVSVTQLAAGPASGPPEPAESPEPPGIVAPPDQEVTLPFDTGSITTAPIEDLQTALQDGDRSVFLWGHSWTNPDNPLDGNDLPRAVSGFAHLSRTNGEFLVDGGDLDCDTCTTPDCVHVQDAANALAERLNTPQERPRIRSAGREVLDQAAGEHAASQAAQAAAQQRWPAEPEVSYSTDFAAFQQAYQEANGRAERGEAVIPYMTENATAGLGAREGGRGFGLELEFDLDHSNHGAIHDIARDLHAAGLSQDPDIHGYHASRTRGYTDAPNGWRLEEDCTVSGELVSPILYDEPATWENLAKVCDIIRRHGGRASVRTGGHVHISTHDYDHGVENHNRLLNTYTAYEDVLYRLAGNPERRRHRGTEWCIPNRVHANGYRTVGQVARNHYHGHAINMSSTRGDSNDHMEYRLWDGSLDPATIQTQVKLSLGLTEAAFRNAGSSAHPNDGEHEPLGTHRRRRSSAGDRGRLTGQQWRENTASFRRLMDEVFHRASDKAQATALFASTRWNDNRY